MSAVGAWSLVPPLLTIALAILTRQAVLSLSLGIWPGGVIARFADSVDHVRTQLYYAVTVSAVAVLLLLTWGVGYAASGGPPDVLADNLALLPLPVGVVLLVALVYGLSELDARRKGLEPVAAATPQERPDAEPLSDD